PRDGSRAGAARATRRATALRVTPARRSSRSPFLGSNIGLRGLARRLPTTHPPCRADISVGAILDATEMVRDVAWLRATVPDRRRGTVAQRAPIAKIGDGAVGVATARRP